MFSMLVFMCRDPGKDKQSFMLRRAFDHKQDSAGKTQTCAEGVKP